MSIFNIIRVFYLVQLTDFLYFPCISIYLNANFIERISLFDFIVFRKISGKGLLTRRHLSCGNSLLILSGTVFSAVLILSVADADIPAEGTVLRLADLDAKFEEENQAAMQEEPENSEAAEADEDGKQ